MSGGNDGYFGYEYQFWASVLLMLNAHSQGTLTEFIVESDFGNDAEMVSESEPNQNDEENEKSLDAKLVAQSDRIVQIKTKSRKYQWQPAEFRDILLKQDERTSDPSTVLDKLFTTDSQFLFVTDGSLAPALYDLLIELDSGERSSTISSFDELSEILVSSVKKDDELRSDLKRKLTKDVISRISVIDTLRIEDIKLRIREMVQVTYGVAPYQIEDSVNTLVSLVRSRALKECGTNRIAPQDIENVIGKPEKKAPFPDLNELFVEVSSFTDALNVLHSHNMVFLVGEPGIGKTTIASALANHYCNHQYSFEQLPNRNAHLSILSSCSQGETKVFLADDVFGYETYDGESQFERHVDNIVQRTKVANGRVKVIVTTRTNVFTEVSSQIRMQKDTLSTMTVRVPQPDTTLKSAVLASHVRNDMVQIEWIYTSVNVADFEDLLHVRQFAEKFDLQKPNTRDGIHELFEISRPSLYRYWLKKLPTDQTLFLYVLWSIIELKRFAFPDELQQMFQSASKCAELPSYTGLRSRYSELIKELSENQQRLQLLPNGAVDFIHPQLRSSVQQHFKEETQDLVDFVGCWVDELIAAETPISHSIAVLLCILSGKRDSSLLAPQLAQLTQSRYVQTIETFLLHGGTQFLVRSSEGEHDKTIYSYLYTPQQCEIDENGYLVRKSDFGIAIGELAEDLMWELGAIYGGLDKEEEDIYKSILENRSYQKHNPLERHKFSRWLSRRKEGIKESDVLEWLQYIASDPISFVRSTALGFLSPTIVCTNAEFRLVFRSLCYDSHPLVKIDILENFILFYWHDQQPEIQKEWIQIVLDMLDDPVVKDRTAKGLINASEHKTYHKFHTKEQQLEWFCTVAPKLLAEKFGHHSHFEDTLDKFEHYFADLPMPFRVSMLQLVADYVDRHPYSSEDTVYTIQNLLLRNDLEQTERDILTNLINRLSPWGRAYIAHRFAQSYSDLPDERLRSFVHRPFYVESAGELIPERVALLLGFLANSEIKVEDLPASLIEQSGNTVQEKISEYINQQDDRFKLLTLFSVYGYGHTYHLTIPSTALRNSALTRDLIEHFCLEGTLQEATLVADMLQSRGYYSEYEASSNSQTLLDTGWYQLFSKFIFHRNDEIAKASCRLVFEANLASSVHNLNHFVELLCLMAEHPSDSVKQEVRQLINEYWFEIHEQLRPYPHLPSSWQELIKEQWFPLVSEISENNSNLKLWFTLKRTTAFAIEMWGTWNEGQRQEFINIATGLVLHLPSRSLSDLVLDFYEAIRDTLNEEQKQVFDKIQELHHSVFDEKHNNLREMSPDFDWSFFYEEN